MDIVFICAEFPYKKQSTGGFGSYVERIALALSTQHSVRIICWGDENRIIIRDDIEIHVIKPILSTTLQYIGSWPIPYLKRLTNFLTYPFLFSFSAAQTVNHLHHLKNIDLVEGGDFGAELFFYLLTKSSRYPKVVIKLHTPSFLIREYNEEKRSMFYMVMNFLEEYCVQKVDAVYSPSRNLAQLIRKKYNRKISKIIPYPVINNQSKINIENRRIILYVGKIQKKKGVFVLADAIPKVIAENPKAQFYFIGSDTLEDHQSSLKKLISLLRKNKVFKNVEIFNSMPQAELFRFYKRAAITVVPSLWENFPNVLLEAALFGSSIVGTSTGGIKEIIKNKKTGILVPANDAGKLARAILLLLNKKKMRVRYAEKLRRHIKKNYHPQEIAKKTLMFYGKILTD